MRLSENMQAMHVFCEGSALLMVMLYGSNQQKVCHHD